MMLRRSHPGREVQGGAATCRWVLGGDSRSRGGSRERLCHSRDKMPSWCDTAQPGTGTAESWLIWVQGMQAGKQRAEREERRGMEQAKEELNGKGAEEGRHKSLSRARRSVSRRMSPGAGRIDSFLQQPARKKCFTVLQDTDSSQLMFLRALN